MRTVEKSDDDSSVRRGGWVAGLAGAPAFVMKSPTDIPIPVLIAAPHGGRTYPSDVLRMMRQAETTRLKLEDRLVDLLAERAAEATGAALLVARAPRAMIDLNRAIEEMDWTMVRRSVLAPRPSAAQAGRRARGGLGLVPRRLPGMGEIWNRQFDRREVEERIDGIHIPYHQALAAQLRKLRDQWGAALLIDLHSMPPLAPQSVGEVPARFVIGDRFGASCDGSLCAAALDHLDCDGRVVAHNRPYAGGYVLDRHAAPQRGIHALQLEICRTAYLDSQLANPGEGLEDIANLLSGLVRRLAVDVAALGRGAALPQAAE